MRDYKVTAKCCNGHKWEQHITADSNGQDSVTFESEELCPECGMCSVDCMGCELCEPEVDPFIEKITAICDTYGRIAAERLRREWR